MHLGIDTHKRYSQVAVVDGDGNLQEESRLPNDRLEELAKQYTGVEAAIEASGHYRPIYEMLARHPGCHAHDSASFAHGSDSATCSKAHYYGRSLASHILFHALMA